MKLLNIILIKLSILFTASCGCEGYGYEPEASKPTYTSLLILEDTLDEIKTISYNNNPPTIPSNRKITPISVTQYEPEFIQINTLKHTFSFRARTNANYNYSDERKCNQGNLRITYGNPTIDSISRGTLTLKRAYVYNSYFSQSLEFIVDSIKFSYP